MAGDVSPVAMFILIMCYLKKAAPTDCWMVECKCWQQNPTNPENCSKFSQILSTSKVISNIYDSAVATQTHLNTGLFGNFSQHIEGRGGVASIQKHLKIIPKE